MARYSLEVRLPDRPGALGAVASRIGAVGGDIIAVDIVTRGGEHAVDEFVVDMPGDDLVSLLLTEIHEVDGVDVVEIRPLPAEEPRA
jgi:ACT domain-containing protein